MAQSDLILRQSAARDSNVPVIEVPLNQRVTELI
jgi:hypothetical protein